MRKIIFGIIIVAIATIFTFVAIKCHRTNEADFYGDTTCVEVSFEKMMESNNRVSVHDERDTIIGNFTGKGIDTLFVKKVSRADIERDSNLAKYEDKLDLQQDTLFFLESTNPEIPFFQLCAWSWIPPKLVNEGDLDGNGTCDFGYLQTWLNSQWRSYEVLTFYKGEWRYLIDDDKLFTSAIFRCADIEIVEPGPRKGLVKINYLYEGHDVEGDEPHVEMRDTLVKPNYINMGS